MIKNYLKIAWRNLVKNKVYSALNIVGLAAGMAVALIIALWVYDQYSFDRFLPNIKNLYQVQMNITSQHDGTHTQTAVAIPLSDVLRSQIPGIKRVAETDWIGSSSRDLMVGDKKLYLDGGSAVPAFMQMFQYPLIKGNRETMLNDPFSIVIDESTATALFGDADPMGKVIRVDNLHDVKVTGVMKNIPANSSLKFSFMLPFSYKEATEDGAKQARVTWTNNSYQIFVELQPNADFNQVSQKIKGLVAKNNDKMATAKPELFLHPLEKWHLYSTFKNGVSVGGFIDYVRMFSIIGILVLLIACINFMNLSTARSEKRAREVGVRKTMGSSRAELIVQFLTESVLITFIASMLSLIFVQLALPSFNTLTESSISIPYLSPVFWAGMLGYVFLTGLLAGSRPAFYLSSFLPVKVLKGTLQTGKAAALPRKILVVLQFTCSIALIISTVIIYQQVEHAKNRPTGYDSERLVMTDMSDDLNKNYPALKADLLQSGLVESVATATSAITYLGRHISLIDWPGKHAGEESVNIGSVSVSEKYFSTLGMQLIDGTDFTSSWSNDTSKVILNEAAVKRIGLKNPVGQLIKLNKFSSPMQVIGVVKDALMESPFTPINPVVYNHGNRGNGVMYRLAKGIATHDAMEKITHIFNKYNPAYPFVYQFVNDEYNHKFGLELLIGKLAGVFSALAIFISCLGLFGLAAYVAEQRNKEIGVRKVLGASVTQVWLLLSGDFILLVVISCVIASPIAFYFLHGWLQKYEYRIEIGSGVFLLSSASAVILTLLTVSFQAIKAALASPVRSLRSE